MVTEEEMRDASDRLDSEIGRLDAAVDGWIPNQPLAMPQIEVLLGDNEHRFRLLQPFRYQVNQHETIVVPEGFRTDFTTVPAPLRWVVDPLGPHVLASVVHDWLYTSRIYTRSEADRIYRDIMRRSGVGRVSRGIIYAGVRIGGWWPWWRNTSHRRSMVDVDDNPALTLCKNEAHVLD